MMSVILLLPIGSLVINWLIKHSPEAAAGIVVLDLARWSLAIIAMFAVLSVIYYFGPSISIRFRVVSPGAVFVVILWIVLGLGFRFYIQNFAQYDKMYGALAGVVILMMVLYIGAVILLVGAEINSEIDLEMYRADKKRADIRLDYEPPPPSH
jgi:membrane protein